MFVCVCVCVCVCNSLCVCMHGWMDGWMDGWLGGWMDMPGLPLLYQCPISVYIKSCPRSRTIDKWVRPTKQDPVRVTNTTMHN